MTPEDKKRLEMIRDAVAGGRCPDTSTTTRFLLAHVDALRARVSQLEKQVDVAPTVFASQMEDNGLVTYYTAVREADSSHRAKLVSIEKLPCCKDCGVPTKPGRGSARCPGCWDDKYGG